jgi:beta-phosphoglucomutase-like phosphatase (HAD superfamily)
VKDPRYDAVIFDMDGLMVNTEDLYCRTFNEALDRFGAPPARDHYTVCVGHPVEDNSRYAVEHYRLNTSPETFCRTWLDRFDQAIADPAQVGMMPGFPDLLAHVRKKGYRLGVASSTSRPRLMTTLTNGVLAHLDGLETLDDIFDTIVSGSDVARTKPFPDIYLLAAERLRVPPARCLALEDSESGAKAARAAGLFVIAVPHVFTAHQDHSFADVRVTCLKDVIKKGLL